MTKTNTSSGVESYSRKCMERLDCFDPSSSGCSGSAGCSLTCDLGTYGQDYICAPQPPAMDVIPETTTIDLPPAAGSCTADKPLQCWRCAKASSLADCRNSGYWQNCAGPVVRITIQFSFDTKRYEVFKICTGFL